MTVESTKRCPFCGEEILAVAVRCKHCQADLSGGTAIASAPTRAAGEGLGITLLLLPLAGTLLLWFWVGSMSIIHHPENSLKLVVALVVLATTILAAIEASKLGVGSKTDLDKKGRPRSGPGTWAVFHLVMWIVAYPAYLFWRSKYGVKNLVVGGLLVTLVFLGSAAALNSVIDGRTREFQRTMQGLQNPFGQ